MQHTVAITRKDRLRKGLRRFLDSFRDIYLKQYTRG